MQPLDSQLSRTEIVELIEIDQPFLIQTKDDGRFVLMIKEISEEAIIGIEREVPFQNIQEISTEKFNIYKSAGTVVASSVAVVYVAILLWLGSL